MPVRLLTQLGRHCSLATARWAISGLPCDFSTNMHYSFTSTSKISFIATVGTAQTVDFVSKNTGPIDFNGTGSWILATGSTHHDYKHSFPDEGHAEPKQRHLLLGSVPLQQLEQSQFADGVLNRDGQRERRGEVERPWRPPFSHGGDVDAHF